VLLYSQCRHTNNTGTQNWRLQIRGK